MRVEVVNANAKQLFFVDEPKHFQLGRDTGLWQILQGLQHHFTVEQIAQGYFTDDKGVCQHLAFAQPPGQSLIRCAQVINPDGGIDQNHAGTVWRLGISANCGSEPPSKASRLALSR